MEFNATFFVSAISFILFVVIMNAICYKPMEQIVEQRRKFIDDTNEVAHNNLEKSEKLLADKEEKILETKQEAKKVINQKTIEAQQQKTNMQSEVQKASREKIENAKKELYSSKADAENTLSSQIDDLANQISAKISG